MLPAPRIPRQEAELIVEFLLGNLAVACTLAHIIYGIGRDLIFCNWYGVDSFQT